MRCGDTADGPYCPECRPKHHDPAEPFWGGQGATPKQRRERRAFLLRHPVCQVRLVCNGAPATQVDHIEAQSRGGADDASNWQASCGPCNLAKGA